MKEKKRLTDHIREELQNHEEPYVLGSWERFQEHSRKENGKATRKTIYRAAASTLLILSLFYAWSISDRPADPSPGEPGTSGGPDILEIHPFLSDQDGSLAFDVGEAETSETGTSGDETSGNGTSAEETSVDLTGSERTAESGADDEPGGIEAGAESPGYNFAGIQHISRKDVIQQRLTDTGRATGQASFIPSYRNSGQRTSIPQSVDKPVTDTAQIENYVQEVDIRSAVGAPEKNMRFSVAYASMMHVHGSQTDWGIGGGLYADWNLSGNIAVSSGLFIAQNQLKYEGENGIAGRVADNETLHQASGDLSHMQVDLVSLEIPLNLRYSLNRHFSVSAGISSMAFIKENYDYIFEYQQEMQTFEASGSQGLESVTRMVTMTESQLQSEPSLNAMDWTAFYTFSVGYQHEIASRHLISLEPFLKVPTGRLTSREIRYSTGGIQLKISF